MKNILIFCLSCVKKTLFFVMDDTPESLKVFRLARRYNRKSSGCCVHFIYIFLDSVSILMHNFICFPLTHAAIVYLLSSSFSRKTKDVMQQVVQKYIYCSEEPISSSIFFAKGLWIRIFFLFKRMAKVSPSIFVKASRKLQCIFCLSSQQQHRAFFIQGSFLKQATMCFQQFNGTNYT